MEISSYHDLLPEHEGPSVSDPDEDDDAGPTRDDEKDLPARSESSDRSLPVTGGSLSGLVIAATVAVAVGGAALWSGRTRRTAAGEETPGA